MDTADFFQPGTTYQRGRWLFQCLAVESAPWDGALRAVGFLFRDGTGAVHGMTADDWAHREWVAPGAGRKLMDEIDDCTCIEFCDEDPKTACRLSGRPHVHPDDRKHPGTYGPCPVHPGRPGDH